MVAAILVACSAFRPCGVGDGAARAEEDFDAGVRRLLAVGCVPTTTDPESGLVVESVSGTWTEAVAGHVRDYNAAMRRRIAECGASAQARPDDTP